MKRKIAMLILTLSLAISMTACGGDNKEKATGPEKKEDASKESDETTDDLESLGDVDVEKGIFDVELTIPADYVGEQTQEDLDKIAEEHGFQSIILNSDGSATYTMTKKQHSDLMDEYRDQINNNINEMIGSEDYPNFTKIEANENFTEFTVTTKSVELDMNESFSTMAFYMYGGLYSVFSGENISNVSVTFVNADSGNIISTANSSEMAE